VKHQAFKDFKVLQELVLASRTKKLSNGNPLKISEVRQVVVTKGSDLIWIKTLKTAGSAQCSFAVSRTAAGSMHRVQLPQLYDAPLCLPQAKVKDLTTLCSSGVIPQRYHTEYTQLCGSTSVPDCLAETETFLMTLIKVSESVHLPKS
jgi:hypothetical protein